MDFLTFSDAFAHNKRSKQHLINLIMNRVDSSPEFSLFLGAGASITSGIKPANKMIFEWQRQQYASCKATEEFSDWIKSQEWHETDGEYSRLFELVYDQPSQRRAYIESAIKDSRPNLGYAYLTSLVKENIFNVIFTTNFDDLINDSFYRFENELRPMVCAHDSGINSVRLMSDRPKVIKLHGDFLYDSIKNTSSELQSLEGNMRQKFMEFAKEYGLVVVGYSGNDQSVMDLLDVLVRSESYFRNGIYWCVRKGSSPCRRLRQLLRNDRVYWIEFDGFDELMSEVADSLDIELPEGIVSPHITAIKRTKYLHDAKNKFENPFLTRDIGDLKEMHNRIQSALNEVGLESWNIRTENDDLGISELRDNTIPYLECIELFDNSDYCGALPKLKNIVETENQYAKGSWSMLMECLLIDPNLHDEAKTMILSPVPPGWHNSMHFVYRSFFALCLNMEKEALSFAERALELNSDLPPAKVNKAIAHMMGGDEDKMLTIANELKSEKYGEQYRAAAYALSGNFQKTISLLQKAIVLGRYTTSSACRDVVFRPYWKIDQFTEKLKVLSSRKKIELRYLEACPMSEKEEELYERIVATL